MDVAQAVEFIAGNSHAVMHTYRRDGSAQLSPLDVTVDDDGRVLISSRETAMKVKNLARDPRATICVLTERFYGDWVVVSGTAEIVHLPEAMDLLVEYYRRAAGEHPDWDDYRAAMERERRVLIRVSIERAGPDVAG